MMKKKGEKSKTDYLILSGKRYMRKEHLESFSILYVYKKFPSIFVYFSAKKYTSY